MRIVIFQLALLLAACSPAEADESYTESGTTSSPSRETDTLYDTCDEAIADGVAPLNEGDDGYSEELDEDGDGVACENYSQTDDFEQVGDTSQCTGDCSGHNAGFDWARDHDITDESECTGYSQSFIEGCETYVAEQ